MKPKLGMCLLMWAHYCYLLMLPTLAAIAAERLGLEIKFAEVVVTPMS